MSMSIRNQKGIQSFRDLVCWQLAREIVQDVYGFADRPKFRRDFTLVDQSKRSSTSIMFNISEGFERDGNREFLNFLSIAKGSCGELSPPWSWLQIGTTSRMRRKPMKPEKSEDAQKSSPASCVT